MFSRFLNCTNATKSSNLSHIAKVKGHSSTPILSQCSISIHPENVRKPLETGLYGLTVFGTLSMITTIKVTTLMIVAKKNNIKEGRWKVKINPNKKENKQQNKTQKSKKQSNNIKNNNNNGNSNNQGNKVKYAKKLNKNKTENNIKNTDKSQKKEEQKHIHIYFPI